MKILMVLTSHEKLDTTGKRTRFWLEAFSAPYYVFKDATAKVTLASSDCDDAATTDAQNTTPWQ